MKDELGRCSQTKKIFLLNDDKDVKKAKETIKYVLKRILKFNDYKNCLIKNEIIPKSQERLKIERH